MDEERIAAMQHGDLFLSVITVGEIAKGVALASAGAERHRYETFLLELEQSYGSRILEVDIETAHIWGDIIASCKRNGRTLPACDGLIAATAIRHGLRVVTNNVRHFAETGAMVLDPLAEA